MAMRVAWLKDLRLKDLDQVGGKNASLGEMIGGLSAAGIRVPGGFATTADAFREFLSASGLDKRIDGRLRGVGEDHLGQLRAEPAPDHGPLPGFEHRLVDVELVRVHRALHHRLA